MACQAIHLWKFNGLVAAFLDLGIAYLLLCASSLVYVASKFLGLFGLRLPCPCDGLFGNLSSDHCFQKLLLDRSSKRISSVLYSVKEKCPFDSMWNKEPNCCFKSILVHDRNVNDRHIECEGEGMVCRDLLDIEEPDAEVHRSGNGLRRRRKGVAGHRKFLSVSSNDTLQLQMEGIFQSPSNINRFGDYDTDDSFFSVDSGDGREASTDSSDHDKIFPYLQLDDSQDEKLCLGMDDLSAEEAGNDDRGELRLDGNESITLLKRALEEEQSARATLYLELEKERNAAASAADEAMAMILRLQEEKASIEMEARQYQRMIEEKTAYDAEEMDILKEILVRREREMHFMEKEVEAYRKNIFENDEVDADTFDMTTTPQMTSSFPYSTEDPSHMLQQIKSSNSEKQDANYTKRSSEQEIPPIESRNLTFEFEEESSIAEVGELSHSINDGDSCMHRSAEAHLQKFDDSEEINNDLQEKGMVSVDDNSYNLQDESKGLGINGNSIISIRDDHEKFNNVPYNLQDDQVGYNVEPHGDYQNQSVTDTDPNSHDIHVIVNEARMCGEVSINASKELMVNGASSNPVKCDSPSFSLLRGELDITRSNSDATGRFPPMAHSHGNRLRSELRRNSMSAVDYERSKLGNEVEWLRERLKVVREGREKLTFTKEYKEKENNQLQLLENITNHLQEIRQSTDPGKGIRQASLPPSKDVSKKRCWRSSSLSVHRSS